MVGIIGLPAPTALERRIRAWDSVLIPESQNGYLAVKN